MMRQENRMEEGRGWSETAAGRQAKLWACGVEEWSVGAIRN